MSRRYIIIILENLLYVHKSSTRTSEPMSTNSKLQLLISDDLSKELYTIKGAIIFAIFFVCFAGAFIGTLEVIACIAEELRLREEQIRLREEQIRLRERELAQRSTLQIDADIQLCERLAQFFERSAFAIRTRAHELEIERELFADTAAQDEFGGD
ncbi:hypothetical protein C8R42DRAFT_648993 [Lentinula raphanica]|nr:hypothetical protein C8R42DRAFT_648993 [Lentinula raphanica]